MQPQVELFRIRSSIEISILTFILNVFVRLLDCNKDTFKLKKKYLPVQQLIVNSQAWCYECGFHSLFSV